VAGSQRKGVEVRRDLPLSTKVKIPIVHFAAFKDAFVWDLEVMMTAGLISLKPRYVNKV
jgi:hypothetical protein